MTRRSIPSLRSRARFRSACGNSVRERGAALVEAAVIFPFLLILMLGIIEFGFALRDTTVVSRSVQQSGRVVANQATDRFADYEALRVINSTLSSLQSGDLERVIVFNATSGNTEPSARCLAVVVTDDFSRKGRSDAGRQCNVYGPRQVTSPSIAGFQSNRADLRDCTATSWDANWCPPLRQRQSDTPDRVGVYVEVTYGQFTGILPGDLTLGETSIFLLEPCTAFDPEC